MNSDWNYRLLLVEDDDDHADLILGMLERTAPSRIRELRVTSATEGLEAMAELDFDVILLDLSLPDSEPRDTLETYTSRFPHAPIVVLTSLAEEDLIREAISKGAQDYLDKSAMRGDVVVRAIRYAVERKRNLFQLEKQNEELKRFAHTVAHELKTPLQCVYSALHTVKDSAELNEVQTKLTDLGIQSSEHLKNLIDGLLTFAEAGDDSVADELVDMHKVTEQIIDTLLMTSGEVPKDSIQIHDRLPVVTGSSLQLRQVMENLISNAIRYRSESPLKVNIYSEAKDDFHTFTVQDNGIGIKPEYHASIFETLFRAPENKHLPGTGIGLGFCKNVITRHGGEMSVKSAAGEGSEFSFTLPARD